MMHDRKKNNLRPRTYILSDEQAEKIEAMAAALGCNKSEMIRRLVDDMQETGIKQGRPAKEKTGTPDPLNYLEMRVDLIPTYPPEYYRPYFASVLGLYEKRLWIPLTERGGKFNMWWSFGHLNHLVRKHWSVRAEIKRVQRVMGLDDTKKVPVLLPNTDDGKYLRELVVLDLKAVYGPAGYAPWIWKEWLYDLIRHRGENAKKPHQETPESLTWERGKAVDWMRPTKKPKCDGGPAYFPWNTGQIVPEVWDDPVHIIAGVTQRNRIAGRDGEMEAKDFEFFRMISRKRTHANQSNYDPAKSLRLAS